MSALGSFVRVVRHLTDLMPPFSFNHQGFTFHALGFDGDDLPTDVHGRVAIVTGANSGIGFETARALTKRGFQVWLLCRDETRGSAAKDAILREQPGAEVHLAIVDISSLASIHGFADAFAPAQVDVLVHNAGVLPREKMLSPDGFELTFATSVVGPFALSARLHERLVRAPDARVIFVASGGMYAQRLDVTLPDVDPGSFDGVVAYANAKRAQVILAHLLADRTSPASSITFASMHPGWADTAAVKSSLPRFHAIMAPWLRTPTEGADTVVWLAASPRVEGTRGAFWFDRRVAAEYPLPWTREDVGAREALYTLCERLTGMRWDGQSSHSRRPHDDLPAGGHMHV